MTPERILFFVLAAIAIVSALGMLLSRNAVHSALFLVGNFATVAVFFLLLHAPFIAMVQVTVYAGAIMVLFLFVIMLLGAEQLRYLKSKLPWQNPVAVTLGILFFLAVWFFAQGVGGPVMTLGGAEAKRAFGSPQAIGQLLFSGYLLPFELTSFLLLVAMIGAVVLTRDDKKSANPRAQGPRPQK